MSITCGECTASLGRALGCQVKHDTIAEVRDCFERKYRFEATHGKAIGTCSWWVEIPTASLHSPEEEWYPDSPADVYTTVDCGAPMHALNGSLDEGWTCRAGHEHLAYGSPAQQAQERLEAMVEDFAARDPQTAARLDAGETWAQIAGIA
jgi:hypothetical protein